MVDARDKKRDKRSTKIDARHKIQHKKTDVEGQTHRSKINDGNKQSDEIRTTVYICACLALICIVLTAIAVNKNITISGVQTGADPTAANCRYHGGFVLGQFTDTTMLSTIYIYITQSICNNAFATSSLLNKVRGENEKRDEISCESNYLASQQQSPGKQPTRPHDSQDFLGPSVKKNRAMTPRTCYALRTISEIRGGEREFAPWRTMH